MNIEDRAAAEQLLKEATEALKAADKNCALRARQDPGTAVAAFVRIAARARRRRSGSQRRRVRGSGAGRRQPAAAGCTHDIPRPTRPAE